MKGKEEEQSETVESWRVYENRRRQEEARGAQNAPRGPGEGQESAEGEGEEKRDRGEDVQRNLSVSDFTPGPSGQSSGGGLAEAEQQFEGVRVQILSKQSQRAQVTNRISQIAEELAIIKTDVRNESFSEKEEMEAKQKVAERGGEIREDVERCRKF